MPTEPTDFVLRQAQPTDALEIAELYLAARKAAVPVMPPLLHDDDSVRVHFAALADREEFWVAAGDGLLGFMVLTDTWLNGLYVGPQHQGSGVGTALLDLAKSVRPRGFALWVFASNAPARGFYHRHGLLELEHTDGSGNEEKCPDVRMAWPGMDPLRFLRTEIDLVDDELAVLLSRRSALTTAVQGVKRPGGRAGRDPQREREIVERMTAHAPGLGREAIQRIMHTIIAESLDAS